MSDGVKFLKVPESVVIYNRIDDGRPRPLTKDGGTEPVVYTFRKVVLLALEHEVFRASRENWRIGDKIADWAETLQPGQIARISEAHLALLKQAVASRSVFQIASWVLRQLQPHFDAIEEGAKDSAEACEPAPPEPVANGVAHAPAPEAAQA